MSKIEEFVEYVIALGETILELLNKEKIELVKYD